MNFREYFELEEVPDFEETARILELHRQGQSIQNILAVLKDETNKDFAELDIKKIINHSS
jgi:hypothetical protein